MSETNCENLVEHHGTFIFTADGNSSGIDKSGEAYDHSFSVENGRVSWTKEEDSYLVSLTDKENNVETRLLTYDQLKDWFYAPTLEFYKENISSIAIK